MGSPGIDAPSLERVVVGVGEMAVSNKARTILTTYGLGSCVGVLVYDPFIRVAGLLHLILPDSRSSAEKAAAQPAMFADTGLPLFFEALSALKAELSRVRIYLAGGASVLNGHDPFRIGERNAQAAINWLRDHGLKIHQEHLGGTVNRTVHLEIDTGLVSLKTPTGNATSSLAG